MARRLRRVIARSLPNANLLNVVFGLSAAVAINLLTAEAVGELSPAVARRVQLGGWSFLAGSILVGALGVIMSRVREEALEGVRPTLSTNERRAQIIASLEGMAFGLGTVTVIAITSFTVGLIGLASA
jgi:hypothetical protein